MPTEEDYLDLELTLEEARSFVVQVSEQAPALMEKARQHPGEETRGVIAERLGVGVVVEVVVVPGEDESLEEVWIGFEMPPLPGDCELPAQPEWITVVLAAMLPVEATLDNVDLDLDHRQLTALRAQRVMSPGHRLLLGEQLDASGTPLLW